MLISSLLLVNNVAKCNNFQIFNDIIVDFLSVCFSDTILALFFSLVFFVLFKPVPEELRIPRFESRKTFISETAGGSGDQVLVFYYSSSSIRKGLPVGKSTVRAGVEQTFSSLSSVPTPLPRADYYIPQVPIAEPDIPGFLYRNTRCDYGIGFSTTLGPNYTVIYRDVAYVQNLMIPAELNVLPENN